MGCIEMKEQLEKIKSLLAKFEKIRSIKFGKSCNKILKGGIGSGNFGHVGRAGEVGGSDSGDGGGGDNSKTNIFQTTDTQGNKVEQQFIREPDKSQISNPSSIENFNKLPQKEGWEIVYKPYGEKGRGYYYSRAVDNNTQPSGIREHLFNADNARMIVADRFNSEIKAPYIQTDISTLGGKENASVMMTVSLDPKESWNNGIMENSRYAKFMIERDGRIEAFTQSYKLANKFRSAKVKSISDAITKINNWVDKNK